MPESTLDKKLLEQWLGKCQDSTDYVDVRPANMLRATIAHGRPQFQHGDTLPAAWHWLYFLDMPAMDKLGRDGHAALGDFLPPVALPVRMWAGARLRHHQPVRIGDKLKKSSVIKRITRKSGKSGELCFVTVNHRIFSGKTLKLEEDHDIVYREDTGKAPGTSPPLAPTDAVISTTVEPDTTLLFRYSALTFNGHRIHYDVDYCREVEGYPGLVVHAPLTATLLLELVNKYRSQDHATTSVLEFSFRAVSPLFHDRPFTLGLKPSGENTLEAWAANPDGRLAMQATIGFA